jgi:H+/Cl- antiporter ClcA
MEVGSGTAGGETLTTPAAPVPGGPAATGQAPQPPAAPDPSRILRSRPYIVVLVLAAITGAPVAVVAYFFLKLIDKVQTEIYTDLPKAVGFHAEPVWWPLPCLAIGGLVVALAIIYLPGTGGHEPAEGFKSSGPVPPVQLFGIVAAAFVTLVSGAVLGPEAPLIAIGSGLGVLAVQLVKKDAPQQAVMVIAAAGSFAAISTLLGSPIVGAFLLMEMAGLGGPMMEVVLVPGLLAAGIGSLIFVGLGDLTGFGTFSLQVPHLPTVGSPTGGEFLWAIVIGVAAGVLGVAVFRLAKTLQAFVVRRRVLLTPVIGLAVGGIAVAFAEGASHSSSFVLFSGQTALPELVDHAAAWSAGSLVLLVVCKALAYSVSLSGFRGGPIFPSLLIGAAGGIALSHLPGLTLVGGAAMGVGAMSAAVLGMPLSSVLLASLLFASDSLEVIPLVIVAVVVAFVVSTLLKPPPVAPAAAAAGPAAPQRS